MIADSTVGDLLLEALLQPASTGLSTAALNAVVDGFPRTAVQVCGGGSRREVWPNDGGVCCETRSRCSTGDRNCSEALTRNDTPPPPGPPTHQVDFVKLLMDKLNKLHQRFIDSPYAARFPRPAFKVSKRRLCAHACVALAGGAAGRHASARARPVQLCLLRSCAGTRTRRQHHTPAATQQHQVVVLYVDEATSIQRQLQRAVTARTHNARAKDAGVLGETGGAEGGAAGGAVGDAVSSGGSATHPRRLLQEERPTDLDVHKAQKRYQIFKQHYSAILRLKQFLPFQ
jgi:hypothetical protein